MLKFELKKLFIKEYGLIIIIVLCLFKLFSSWEQFKPQETAFANIDQKNVYTGYLSEFGGLLTDEKEKKILALYSDYLNAAAAQEEYDRKLRAGEYSTIEDYYLDIYNVPDIIRDEEPIKKLFSAYEAAAEDRKNRAIIGFDAPVLQNGIEYPLIFLLCYISAAAFFYERKTFFLQTTFPNCTKANSARVLALFSEILLVWSVFGLIEFFALISEIGVDNLFYSAVSLESFRHSNYPNLSIIGVFIAIHSVKLTGYLLISALSSFLAKVTKNFQLSVFVPISMVIVWLYLFTTGNVAYYNPIALMRGAPYFIGGDNNYNTFTTISQSILAVLIVISLLLTASITLYLIFAVKNRANKLMKESHLMMTLFLFCGLFGLCGCSENTETSVFENTANPNVTYAYGKYFTCEKIDKEYETGNSDIVMRDENFNITEKKINRDLFHQNMRISLICADKDYLYYSTHFGSDQVCGLYRINLSDFTEEILAEFDISAISSGTTKYLDLIRDYPAEYLNKDDYQIDNFLISGNRIIMLMRSGKVNCLDVGTKIISYLFDDISISDICSLNGKVFFINRQGLLTAFDSKRTTVSDRIFTDIHADSGYIYGCNSEGVFRFSAGTFEETKISNTGCNYIAVKNNRLFLQTNDGYFYIDENGEKEISLPENYFFVSLTEDGKIAASNESEIMIIDKI